MEKERLKEGEIPVPPDLLEEALQAGHEYVKEQERLEAEIAAAEKQRLVNPDPKSRDSMKSSKHDKFIHLFYTLRHNPEAMAESKKAAVSLVARQYLSEK